MKDDDNHILLLEKGKRGLLQIIFGRTGIIIVSLIVDSPRQAACRAVRQSKQGARSLFAVGQLGDTPPLFAAPLKGWAVKGSWQLRAPCRQSRQPSRAEAVQ